MATDDDISMGYTSEPRHFETREGTQPHDYSNVNKSDTECVPKVTAHNWPPQSGGKWTRHAETQQVLAFSYAQPGQDSANYQATETAHPAALRF
jgi:hypothetical protein